MDTEIEIPRLTCGVVVEKSELEEIICSEFAMDQVTLVDPDEQTRVSEILFVCSKHSKLLDEGNSLIFLSNNGVDHIAVQFSINKEEENVT